jgi:hypothetical protein
MGDWLRKLDNRQIDNRQIDNREIDNRKNRRSPIVHLLNPQSEIANQEIRNRQSPVRDRYRLGT